MVTAHSLEPLRPWKAEQLGGGYALSSWVERTAYEAAAAVIAVSAGMRADVLRSYPDVDPARVHVVHNGIDTQQWRARRGPGRRARATVSTPTGRRSSSSAGSPGRRACRTSCAPPAQLPPDVQLVLCAGAPDTAEIMAEVEALVADLRQTRDGVVWIDRDAAPRRGRRAAVSAGTVFACPSVYEPLGIVNLEAMACELAVVATATGGIPEVVVDGETGWLVPIEQVDDGTRHPGGPRRGSSPTWPRRWSRPCRDPDRARAYGPGRPGRARWSTSPGRSIGRPDARGLPLRPRLSGRRAA